MGGGRLRNRHVYDVHCVVVTDMTFLKKESIMALDGDFPEFKMQVQKLAAKRAQRFGTYTSAAQHPLQTVADLNSMTAICGAGINLAWSGKGSWSDEKLDGDDLAMMQRLSIMSGRNEQGAGTVSSNAGSPESIVPSVCMLICTATQRAS